MKRAGPQPGWLSPCCAAAAAASGGTCAMKTAPHCTGQVKWPTRLTLMVWMTAAGVGGGVNVGMRCS
jgi:hypothetical protein